MLALRHLSKSYVAGKPVLTDINVEIGSRGITAIIGASGTGKSTLIRCVNRLVEPTAGEILFDGRDLAKLSGAELRLARRQIGMVFQEYNLVERLTVMENLLSGRLGYVSSWRAWRRKFPPDDIRKAFELLDVVGLSGFANRRAHALSGGQRPRVGIARAVLQEPKLLLADEPTAALDPAASAETMEVLARVGYARGIPVLINMHDADLAKRFADRIIGMSAGAIVFDGAPAYLTDDVLRQIYGDETWLR